MFEQAFKNIDDVLWKEAGCSSELDYTEQTSWLLFLKYLAPGRSLGKTNPLNDDDLAEFVQLQKTKADSPKSWTVDAKTIDPTTFDLSVKNPTGAGDVVHRRPQTIMDEIAALDAESATVLGRIRGLL